MRRFIVRASATMVLSGVIALQGCDRSQQLPARSVDNVSEKPLFLRELTTGVKYDKTVFPKLVTSAGNKIGFDYRFFGKDELVLAELDSDKVIYSYEILLKGELRELREAIEEKVSAENGKKIEFACGAENVTWGGADWEHKNCSIVSGTQRLLLTEKRPISRKPASVNELAWASMHTSSVVLEDIELKKQARLKADDEASQKHEADKAKARKDV